MNSNIGSAHEDQSHEERPNKRPKLRNKNVNSEVLRVRRNIQQCCATNDLATALEIYHRAIEDSIRIEAQTFYSLLNLCDGLDRTKVHIGTPKHSNSDSNQTTKKDEPDLTIRDVDLHTRKMSAFEIKEKMDNLKIPLNETAYTALVKILSRAKDVDRAHDIILEAERVQQCRVKLRLYSSLLTTYCEMGMILPALKLWERLSRQGLALTEREYSALIDCCTHTGEAPVMEKVLADLSEDVLVPSKDTCRSIVRWFESLHARPQAIERDAEPSKSLLDEVSLPSHIESESLGSVQCSRSQRWKIDHVCHIDTSTGTLLEGCMKGLHLKPVRVSPGTWKNMMKMNETIVLSGKLDDDTSQFQGGRKGKKRKIKGCDQEFRTVHWKAFNDYLAKRGGQFDIIIDGANVGYYKHNFSGAPKHVDYYQIDNVVSHFLREEKRLLLIMHQRHFADSLMPKRFRHLVKTWEDRGILYKTPAGMNDDWFWLHAALKSGCQTLVVTNDEMRDHHFQMLAPRYFLRWKERHQVHFCFGNNPEQDANENNNGRKVVLTYPEIYSRRIQQVKNGFVIPHPKQGDENRFLDGVHVADADMAPPEETYLCIRPTDMNLMRDNVCR